MKKILFSLLTVSAVAAVAFFGTRAFFSDTEASEGNTFTAGAIDLQVSSTATYNGADVPGSTWIMEDLSASSEKFFNFSDLKPGDYGQSSIGLEVTSNPAWVCATIELTSDDDITCNEPEIANDSSCSTTTGVFNGEIAKNLSLAWWPDLNDDNVLDPGAEYDQMFFMSGAKLKNLIDASSDPKKLHLTLADSLQNFFLASGTQPLAPEEEHSVGIAWCMGDMEIAPSGVITCDGAPLNNESQTDSMTASMSFYAVQERHNTAFRCEDTYKPVPTPTPTPTRYTSSNMNFSDTGWGGWSCPTGKTAVGGGVTGATQPIGAQGIANTGATIGGSTYPVFPHYTFSAGETGYVVQNGGTAQSMVLYVDCI